jgi:SanA protein
MMQVMLNCYRKKEIIALKLTTMRKIIKIIGYGTVIAIALGLILILVANGMVKASAKNKLYTDVNNIPFNRTGLLLGTSKIMSNGRVNPYYTGRIEAALALLRSNKIRYVVVSGDNSRKDYNEPATMRQDLMDGGIDSSRIYLDYAGFRTFDSMVRLKDIFGQDSVTVISQRFHNERALYIAKREGITAIGFNAPDVENKSSWKIQLREKLARVKVLVDYVMQKKPRFGGEKVVLPR